MAIAVVDGSALSPDRISDLFEVDLPNRALLFAVLENTLNAAVIVDDRLRPTRCLLRTGFYGFSFYAGPRDAFLAEAMSAMRAGAPVMLVWPEEWGAADVVPDGYTQRIARMEFTDRHPRHGVEDIAEGLSIRAIDATLLESCKWRNEFGNAWKTPDDFYNGSRGICLTRDAEILCEAYAAWWGKDLCEIGAVTHGEHRRKGYARLLCSHMIAACEGLGVQTTWTCGQNNAGSMATARALGYRTERPYELIEYKPT